MLSPSFATHRRCAAIPTFLRHSISLAIPLRSPAEHHVGGAVLQSLALAVQTLLTCSLLTLSAWHTDALAQATTAQQSRPAADTARHYDIPAGPLSTVLTRFSTDAGIFLIGASELAQGRFSPGVRGSFNAQAALDTLLAGTGLVAQRDTGGRYLLRAAGDTASKTLPVVTVTGKLDIDEQKRDDVYRENVTNLYLGKKELDRHAVHNAADVLKSLTGVYSMDSRNGNSLSPNIRGISGQGRVPVTVDGTEQSTDIWLGIMYGANNKNYVDPALFRSIAVEKGPSLSRGVRSGVGGAVSIRTIEADDIVKEGSNFGAEFKTETSGNTIARRVDPSSYYGQDYRDIPGATVGTPGNVNIPQPTSRTRSDSDAFNLEDKSFMLALAGRNEVVDGLLSYSRRSKGNYFAGKRGADDYRNNNAYAKSTEAYRPNLTKLYEAGGEVLNTSSETSTLLIKNNWRLPHDQRIGLSWMRTWLDFAETNNPQSLMSYGLLESGAVTSGRPVGQWPDSNINMNTYRLSYALAPSGSRWLDFQSNLWTTKVDSRREQNGGAVYFVNNRDALWDDWQSCKRNNKPVSGSPLLCLFNPVLASATPPAKQPNTDGRYNVVPASTQWTAHERNGFDFSNRIRISDRLNLTLTGEVQHEKLNEDVLNLYKDAGTGIGPDGATLTASTVIFGPRSGRRHEWGGSMNVDWSPTPWLTLSAGTRYSEFWAFDDGLAERRRNQVAGSEITRERTGVKLEYNQLMTDGEFATATSLNNALSTAGTNLTPADWDTLANQGITTPNMAAWQAAIQARTDYLTANQSTGTAISSGLTYWKKETVVPVVNGKVASAQSPFANGGIDVNQTASNPQGTTGQYSVYVPTSSTVGTAVYTKPDTTGKWAQPEQRKGKAWSPVLAATLRLTNHVNLFGRYAQITRFPSVFEIASTSIGTDTPYLTQGASKPERSTNWELGYAHDLTQFFPNLRQADVRLSYFDTNIKDFIERDASLNIIQYDRKESSGVEFQSRFDGGRYFGGLGATWRKKQKLCDKDYAYGMDVYFNRVPECMTGGFPDTVTSASLQPKYSLNADLGARLFESKLETGLRAIYHAKAENKQLDEVLSGPLGTVWFGKSAPQYYWNSVLLLDLYAQYQAAKDVAVNFGVTNLTDRYYLDPMAKIPVPGPGRTVSLGLRLSF